ncbi:unnamed protein product, partial [Psylliodes chrysocephalus]
NNIIREVSSIKDHGITLDSKLNFDIHVENIVQKSLRTLGFILRNTKKFSNAKSILILYNSMVRSTLEYGSTLWSPCYYKYISRIEGVQRKLIKHLNYRFNRNIILESYDFSLRHYKINKLVSRRVVAHLIFLYKLINNKIDSVYTLENLNFYAKNHTSRSTNLFFITQR